MSGYIHRDREPMRREQWIAIVLAILAGAFMLFVALYASRVAYGWIGTIGRIPPAAPLMFVLGSNFFIQRGDVNDERPASRWVARHRRLIAGFFYLVGVALIALPFVFPGAHR